MEMSDGFVRHKGKRKRELHISINLEVHVVRTIWKTAIQREDNIKIYLRKGLSESKQVVPQVRNPT